MKALGCKDLAMVLHSENPEMLAEFEQHAASCAGCRVELEAWNEMKSAARGLTQDWESPQLWPRIHKALEEEAVARRNRSSWLALAEGWATWQRWAVAPAFALVLALMVVGTWLLAPKTDHPISPDVQRRLLTEQAVRAVEKSEAAYVESIDKLSAIAAPRIESPKTQLLANYREKLAVLDAAIDDCRAQVNRNPANPQLRDALLSMYRAKQQTLQEVLGED